LSQEAESQTRVPDEAVTSSFRKGMNEFSDVDPRAKAGAAAADKASFSKKTQSGM